jgi:hypothetical protein
LILPVDPQSGGSLANLGGGGVGLTVLSEVAAAFTLALEARRPQQEKTTPLKSAVVAIRAFWGSVKRARCFLQTCGYN